MRHTLSVLVENKFGVLTRISGLFSGRGFNIETLNVAPTQDPATSRMTIVVKGDDAVLEQITKQLNKLVNVIQVQDFREGEYVDRELVLIKVGADGSPLFAVTVASAADDHAASVANSVFDGTVVMCGHTAGNLTLHTNAGGTDAFALRDAGGWSSLAMPSRYVEAAQIANAGVNL